MSVSIGKIARIGALATVAGLIFALVLYNVSFKPPEPAQVWDERTVIGSLDAKHHYVMYTDLMCPYCDVFSRLLMENEEIFKRDYIEGRNIVFEVRVTDFLYEYSSHRPEASRLSAEATYCATNAGRFWDYYHAALAALWEDYHSKGIGVSAGSPLITDMTADYWLEVGRDIGLGEDFERCYTEHEALGQVEENTKLASAKVDGGLPYFKFGSFMTSGFDQGWGWEYVRRYLDAGLK